MASFVSSHTEKELFLLIAEGDEEAFRRLFQIYMPLLYPMILKIVKVGAITEDIIQETFLRLWIYRDKLPEIENTRSWILRIAYYQAFTYLRKKATHQKAIDKIAVANMPDLSRSDTEEAVAFKTMTALIKQAIYKLPAQQKKVYQLNREHGLKIDEIARQMNLSSQSVKNTLGRALKFIRDHIEQAGFLFLLMFFKV